MIRVFKRLRRKRAGFTLIEVIVTVAMVAIISTSVAMLMQPVLNIYMDNINVSQGKMIAANLLKPIRDEIMFCTEITKGLPTPSSKLVLKVDCPTHGLVEIDSSARMYMIEDDGKRIGTISFADEFDMSNKQVKLYLGDVDGNNADIDTTQNKVTLTLELVDAWGETAYRTTETIRMINVPPSGT